MENQASTLTGFLDVVLKKQRQPKHTICITD